MQPLRVSLSVSPAEEPLRIATGLQKQMYSLSGQTQASAAAGSSGTIDISSLLLQASPGRYNLTVQLLDNPQVMSFLCLSIFWLGFFSFFFITIISFFFFLSGSDPVILLILLALS